MAADYEIHEAVDLKYVRIRGFTHLQELRDLAEHYAHDPQFSHRKQLVDLSELTDARAGFRDVLTLRNFYLRTFGPLDAPIRVAIAAPTDLGFGISRMFYMLMADKRLLDIQIFDDLTAACRSFGLSMKRSQGQIRFAPLVRENG